MELTKEMIDNLKTLAKQKCWDDDEYFNPYDYCGGSFSDAHYGGKSDGETGLARSILQQLGVEW